MDRIVEPDRARAAVRVESGRAVRAAITIFTVTGIGAGGLAAVDCGTVSRALAKATDMARRGYADVLIADGTGAQYTPERFVRVFFM